MNVFEGLSEQQIAAINKTIMEDFLAIIGEDEGVKDVRNRSILDGPKVKTQNIYRVARNELRAALRQAIIKKYGAKP